MEATFSAPAGTTWTIMSASDDGNPGKPVREMGLLNRQGRIAWLAFCSGPFLRRDRRQIFPPSDLWKELIEAPPSGFPDRTTVFADSLGLPRELDLHIREGQPILQYLATTKPSRIRRMTRMSAPVCKCRSID